MARLANDKLVLEIIISEAHKHEGIAYDMKLLWDDKSILNPEVMSEKAVPDRITVGGGDFEFEQLSLAIDDLLETSHPQFWQTMEPDITVAFYPDMKFPFVKRYGETWSATPHPEIDSSTHAITGVDDKFSEDVFTVIAMVDAYNLEGTWGYWGQGPAVILQCSRWQLETFRDELKHEYTEAVERSQRVP